jgi:hypothetical protein
MVLVTNYVGSCMVLPLLVLRRSAYSTATSNHESNNSVVFSSTSWDTENIIYMHVMNKIPGSQ